MVWSPYVVASLPAPPQTEQRAASPSGPIPDGPVRLEGVTVTARRGVARQAPEAEYGPAEIDALGAADIGEVVGRLNEAAGGLGPPVVIVNGQRVVASEAFLTFPADALARVEVLPASSSPLYGEADPSRRVINIVLQPRFEGRDSLLSGARATGGGAASDLGDLRRSGIVGMDTNQIGMRLTRDTSLRADERRDYSTDHPGSGATTLRPQTERLALDVSLTRGIGQWRAALAGNLQGQSSRYVSQADGREVLNRSTLRALNLSGGMSGETLGWALRTSVGAQASRSDTLGLRPARSDYRSVNLNLSANRGLPALAAGPVQVQLSVLLSRSRTVSEQDLAPRRHQGRNDEITAQATVPIFHAVPSIAERRAQVGPGDLSISLGAGVRSTDADHGDSLSAGLYWTPMKTLRFNGAWFRSSEAPTDVQRFAPTTYGVPTVVFDFRTGESVQIAPLTGGNASLRTASRDTKVAGVSIGPITARRLSGGLSYRRSDAVNEIGGLPQPTDDIEAAFPERFQRDATGRLVGVDQRPINIASSSSQVLTSTVSGFIPLGRTAGSEPSSLQASLSHAWRLGDATLIKPGLPRMDRLAGDGGGAPGHELAIRLDGRRGAWGGNLTANWRSGYRIRRDAGRTGPDDLEVGDLATTSLQVSYNVKLAAAPYAANGAPPRRNAGLTLSLAIDNILDARPRAHLGDGRPASGYGRDDRDPVGRSVRVAATGRF